MIDKHTMRACKAQWDQQSCSVRGGVLACRSAKSLQRARVGTASGHLKRSKVKIIRRTRGLVGLDWRQYDKSTLT
jgi:hypothetical protein